MALQPCKSQLTDNKCVCAMLNLLRNKDSLKHKHVISVEQRIPFVENAVLSPGLLNIEVSVSVWEGAWGGA